MDKTRIKQLRNAYYRMDDALDGVSASTKFDNMESKNQFMAAWSAHELVADILNDVDPEWKKVNRPETED